MYLIFSEVAFNNYVAQEENEFQPFEKQINLSVISYWTDVFQIIFSLSWYFHS